MSRSLALAVVCATTKINANKSLIIMCVFILTA
jgi:hypothetical protein